jgi:hypothetical protein
MATAPKPTFLGGFTIDGLKFFSNLLGHDLPIRDPNRPTNTPEQARILRQFDVFQKNVLQGFTAMQLKQIGCWNNKDAKPSDLAGRGPIHSLYGKENWSKQTGPPIRDGQGGTYTYENPVVQNALRPALVLASLFLTNIDLWVW